MFRHKSINEREHRFGRRKTDRKTDSPDGLSKTNTLESTPKRESLQENLGSEAKRSRLYDEINRGELDVQAGRIVDALESINRMQVRYDL